MMIACLAIAASTAPVVAGPVAAGRADASPTAPVDARGPVSDPQLVAEIAGARSERGESLQPQSLAVEVLTHDGVRVVGAVRSLGGVVTGQVPGEVLQADMPADRIEELARTPGAEFVQAARPMQRPPRPAIEAASSRALTNEGVAAMDLTAWHGSGRRGAGVKVGVIDFFTMDRWNPDEQGPTPTVANGHMFCKDSIGLELCLPDGSINSAQGDVHGLAVTEIVKDSAPDADVYIATAATVSDLLSVVDWFQAKGVSIVTRSLGSPYDGPGDGSGPLDTVVGYAGQRGMVWFNSAGNDAGSGYMRVAVAATGPDRTVQFTPGDDLLRLTSANFGCFELDGIRWANDWRLPPAERTDYSIEVYQPATVAAAGDLHTNPTDLFPVDVFDAPGFQSVVDASQRDGADPLEATGLSWCTTTGISYLRIVRNAATPVGAQPDVLEIASTFRDLEYVSDPAGSAAKPVVDSQSLSVLAVGALAMPSSDTVAAYSSQGPTNDGRIKPDIVAPSCVSSSAFGTGPSTCFAGTSASAPAAAGAAAVLLSAGLATPGEPLAALVRHLAVDIGAPGTDNVAGNGKLVLPNPPRPIPSAQPSTFTAVPATRILDTRSDSPVGPAELLGIQPRRGLLDLPVTGAHGVPPAGVTAVAVNITAVDSIETHYVQALPTLRGTVGGTSTLNVSVLGQPRANFAIVPVGVGGKISLYMPTGGNVVVDLIGYFAPAPNPAAATAGRFVAISPERWMDTRSAGPYPAGTTAPRPTGDGATVTAVRPTKSAVPSVGVAALVVNITADGAAAPGFLRAVPTGAKSTGTSTVNYVAGVPAANTAIVALGAGGMISVFALRPTNVIVDVMGYITDASAPPGANGLFVALPPGRSYDSRDGGGAPFAAGEIRHLGLAQRPGAPVVAPGASAVSANVTADQGAAVGFVRIYPASRPQIDTSSLNFAADAPVANAALAAVGPGATMDAFANRQVHVIIDVNGYFTGP